MSDNHIKLYGRIFIKANIEAVTGLHIGGSNGKLEIGGLDNAVIRDPLSNRPYIPGSSLRGKMRSQLEKKLGLPQNNSVGQVKIHTCKDPVAYGGCPVCNIFGVPGEVEATGPTRLVVRDVMLSDDSAREMDAARTELPYGELKTEVTIDRVTSAATPRTIERVPAGAVFSEAEIVFSVFEKADFERFEHVLDGLQLLEDDYLGGSGSRGSGKVRFSAIKVTARSGENYSVEQSFGDFENLQALSAKFNDLSGWAAGIIKAL